MNKTLLMKRILLAACSIAMLLDFSGLRYGDRIPEGWWGFYGLYAFCVCIALALLARMLRHLLQRSSDYYEQND